MDLAEVDMHVLDLLVDGESPFAALFIALGRHWGHTNLGVDEALSVLQRLEERRLVHAWQMEPGGGFRTLLETDYEHARQKYRHWLPRATATEVAVDEVGLWYQLTDWGRGAWSRWSAAGAKECERWMLDHRADERVVEARAGRKELAELVLDMWLAEHGEIQEVSGSRASASVPEFALRDGTSVRDGFLVTCRYRTKA